MPQKVQSMTSVTLNVVYGGAGTIYEVQAATGAIYQIFSESGGNTVYRKSIDDGHTWALPVIIHTGATAALAVWFDRWSGIAAGKIHVAVTDSGNDDTWYRSLDTENADALSTEVATFTGNTTATSGGCLSITRARGGNLYIKTTIDAGAEGGFWRSTDGGGTWGSRTNNEATANGDMVVLLPGWGADNQDIMGFFWDSDADEISRILHDDSANSWAETSISTGMVDVLGLTGGFPHFAGAVDLVNSQNILIAWNGVDTANADLKCWTVTESAITAQTDVVTNGTDDQGLAAIAIAKDTGWWYAFYAGKSDGSEVYDATNPANTLVKVYAKISKDGGSTWGGEFAVTDYVMGVGSIFGPQHFIGSYLLEVVQRLGTLTYVQHVGMDNSRRAQVSLGV